jgi:hypothetical protein
MFGKYFSRNRKLLDNRYRGLPFPFQEIEAPVFEKSGCWGLEELRGYLNSWSAVQKFKDEQGHNPAEKFMKQLQTETGWEDREKRPVTFPIFLRLGRLNS